MTPHTKAEIETLVRDLCRHKLNLIAKAYAEALLDGRVTQAAQKYKRTEGEAYEYQLVYIIDNIKAAKNPEVKKLLINLREQHGILCKELCADTKPQPTTN